jgi:hypothetical protein
MTAGPALFVQHHETHRPAAPSPELARGLVPDEAEFGDRSLHPVARLLRDDLRPVDDVGDRGDGDPGAGGDLADAHRHIHPLLVSHTL